MGIGTALGKLGGKIALGWRAHGATITFVGGMVGVAATAVLAAKGWVECKRIIDHKAEEVDRINGEVGKVLTMDDGSERLYTEEDAKHDLKATKRSMIFGCGKALAPAALVGAATMCGFGYSHMNLKGQLASSMAYAGAIETQLSNYRVRWQKEAGVEKEQRVWDGVRTETVVEDVVNQETGEVTTVVDDKVVRDADIKVPSNGEFIVTFGRGCHGFNETRRELNLTQARFNIDNLDNRLQIRDFTDMREVYDEFGVPADKREACETVTGWVRENKDSHIRWEIIDPIDPNDPEVMIRFKTDGLILRRLAELRAEKKLGKYDNYSNPKRVRIGIGKKKEA